MSLRKDISEGIRAALLVVGSGMAIFGQLHGWAAWLFGFLAGCAVVWRFAVVVVRKEMGLGRMRWERPPWPSEERAEREGA